MDVIDLIDFYFNSSCDRKGFYSICIYGIVILNGNIFC